MVKAGRKSINKEAAKANDAQARKLQAELDERLKQFEQRAAEMAKASKVLTRAIAIETGRLPPPWMKQPATSASPTETRSPKSLIGAEVARRIEAGESWDQISKFSVSLHAWMKTLDGVRPLEPRTIENRLRDWGLWPLSPKK